jgi:glycosyltransferase involved in cell wall biosynthesis
MPSVSVVIPAFNAAKDIARAIKSCLEQSHPPLQILVVDDGSSDDTAEIVEAFPEPVRLLRKENGGPASARNVGIRQASGDWVALLDADDEWHPKKLERQLELDIAPQIGIIHGLANTSKPNIPDSITFEMLWDANLIINSSALIRKSVFQILGGFNEDKRLISVEDYNLWLRFAHAGWKIVTCQHEHTYYTRNVGISSHTTRFLSASLFNVDALERELGLPQQLCRRKRLQIFDSFGANALYERKIELARSLLLKSAIAAPTPKRALLLAAAYLPVVALDARRRFATPKRDSVEERQRLDDLPLIAPATTREIDFGNHGPLLAIVVDCEEEFDWRVVPSVSTSVKSMQQQVLAQRIFERYNQVPTYAVDYAVASQEKGYAPLLDYIDSGQCHIGAQLHPWINPPIEEELVERNSFAGNLPYRLEFQKLKVLTETIERNLKCKPLVYRAGRYGAGPNTQTILHELGYKIDCSVLPLRDLRGKQGPDYRYCPLKPYWFGRNSELLEIPVTTGVTGALSWRERSFHAKIFDPLSESLRIPGICARLGLLERIRLTPEGISLPEAKRLTRKLLHQDNQRIFVLSYHSPSLEPGHTPYVRTKEDLKAFLYWIEAYLDFFFGEIGGSPSTVLDIYKLAKQIRDSGR